MKNRIFAICVATLATPLNPNNPAMIATTKKIMAHVSIVFSSCLFFPFILTTLLIKEIIYNVMAILIPSFVILERFASQWAV
jgi:hypothetical protein